MSVFIFLHQACSPLIFLGPSVTVNKILNHNFTVYFPKLEYTKTSVCATKFSTSVLLLQLNNPLFQYVTERDILKSFRNIRKNWENMRNEAVCRRKWVCECHWCPWQGVIYCARSKWRNGGMFWAKTECHLMQECRNYCMCATLADYRCDTSLTGQLSPLNGNYLINTSWMLTAAPHIGKELSWLMAVCHANGLSLSSGRASMGRSALHRSSWPPIAVPSLPDDLLAGAQHRKSRRWERFLLLHYITIKPFITTAFRGTSLDGVFWNVPSKWRKILTATLEQLAFMALVFDMQEAILFGYKSKECLGLC